MIVAIYLRGTSLNPDQISDLLGLSPSRWQKRGELKPGSERFVAKIGLWGLIAQTESDKIDDHIDELLAKLGVAKIDLDKLNGVEQAYLDIFFASDDGQDGRKTVEFMLSRRQVVAVNSLGLSIQVTFS